jgi:hypothetical protein
MVPGDVGGQILQPPFTPGLGHPGSLARGIGVGVSEAAPHLDDAPPTGKRHVGPPGQVRAVKAEAVAHPVHETPDKHLRLGVLASDRPHDAASCFGYVIERG